MRLYIKVLLLAMGSSSHLRGPSQKTEDKKQGSMRDLEQGLVGQAK